MYSSYEALNGLARRLCRQGRLGCSWCGRTVAETWTHLVALCRACHAQFEHALAGGPDVRRW